MQRLISVIIPSYNRLPYLRLTLKGLQQQTLPSSRWEVLVIDDGSQDGTSDQLKQLLDQCKFPSKIITLKENKGRAYARNIGAAQSTGEILLFLDAEVIPGMGLLQQHAELHHKHSPRDVVVSGIASTYSIYTWIYPSQVPELQQIGAIQMDDLQKDDFPTCLLTENAIKHDRLTKMETALKFQSLRKIVRAYGPYLKGFHYPWRSCITAQLSISKRTFDRTGGFDEAYQGWGFEDLDLGYRLMRAGAVFICPAHTTAYHQEHPVETDELFRQKKDNYTRFVSKYGYNDWKITMYSARLFLGCSLLAINRLAYEWEEAVENEQLDALAVYPVISGYLMRWTIDVHDKCAIPQGHERKTLKNFRKKLDEAGYFPMLDKLTHRILQH